MREGLRVLVVEDEILVSMMLEDMLDELGAAIAGVVTTATDALAAIGKKDFDCVLLDMNLNGERGDPIAEELKNNCIPFAILSGGVDEFRVHGAAMFVAKPYKFAEIERALKAIDSELSARENDPVSR